MAKKRPMKDIIVFLPGIMGSVLSRRDTPLWSMPHVLGPAARGASAYFDPLYLAEDDPERETLADGLYPTDLLRGPHNIHRLAGGQGYATICETIAGAFQVRPGTPEGEEPANFIPFPYDWRRDNRVAARRLKRTLASRLKQWRDYTHNPDAKVILIAHSMGGLVARYYLERLDGWKDCRALVTLGTPHRGSLNALDSLVNSHSLGFANLTNLIRSFTSVYQLLPIYRAIRVGDALCRPEELNMLPGISQTKAAQARAFHEEIIQAAESRGATAPYPIIAVSGIYQATYQSAFVEDERLRLSYHLPDSVDAAWLADGDDTVPVISSRPVEPPKLDHTIRYSEHHAWLTSNPQILRDLCEYLDMSQHADYERHFRGGISADTTAAPAGLRLDIERAYRQGQPMTVMVKAIQAETPIQRAYLTVTRGDDSQTYSLEASDGGWGALIPASSPGLHTVEARAVGVDGLPLPPVHALVEVIPEG